MVDAFTVAGSMRMPAGTMKFALMAARGQTCWASVAGRVERTETGAGATAATVLKVQM